MTTTEIQGKADMLNELIKYVDKKLDAGDKFISAKELLNEFIIPHNQEITDKLTNKNQ